MNQRRRKINNNGIENELGVPDELFVKHLVAQLRPARPAISISKSY